MSDHQFDIPDEEEFLRGLEALPNDLGMGQEITQFPDPDDFIPPKLMQGDEGEVYMDVPSYCCPDFDTGPLTEEDTDTLARLQPWLECQTYSPEQKVCAEMWAHREEAAFSRMAALATIVTKLILETRVAMNTLAASTAGDIDLAILSNVAEMARLQRLIPKLRAIQEGMDGVGGDS